MMSHQEDVPECPLCMETFELDDLNFLPCTCGYQICRFCWHRIRTNETGLCPACRKSYPEDPVHFKPLSEDEVHNIKRDRRQKELSRRQKSSENRKHLTNVRVVQKNLVFVVGLSQRLADADILKRSEYFGKFGRIHKVVVNQSTSYVGSQGPSASAYVTYVKPEDAFHAILAVNNLHIDNRNLKASLGTTKYCSQFLKGALCSKSDCMYLHDLGDKDASFSKEDIQQGKHLQYEDGLIKKYSQSVQHDHKPAPDRASKSPEGDDLTEKNADLSLLNNCNNNTSDNNNNSNNNINDNSSNNTNSNNNNANNISNIIHNNSNPNNNTNNNNSNNNNNIDNSDKSNTPANNDIENLPTEEVHKSGGDDDDHSEVEDANEHPENNTLNEDLGFDPWDISSKGLAELIETEKVSLKLEQGLHLGDQSHEGLFSLFHNLSHHPHCPGVPRSPYHSRDLSESDFFKTCPSTFNPQITSNNEHFTMDSRDQAGIMMSGSSPTFPSIPVPSNHCHHNLSWIRLHNNAAIPNNTNDFFTSGLAHNINSDPAIITAGIISGGNDVGLSQPFLNFESKVSSRHLHRLNNPPSFEHRHSKLPPPGFSTTPSAEQLQLPAL